MRLILDELGVAQTATMLIHEGNASAILMANARQPTWQTRHIDIHHFALLDWVKQDLFKLATVETVQNPSNAMTKALAQILFMCHTDIIMGHLLPPYATTEAFL